MIHFPVFSFAEKKCSDTSFLNIPECLNARNKSSIAKAWRRQGSKDIV